MGQLQMRISLCCGHTAREMLELLQGWFWGMETPLVQVLWALSSSLVVHGAPPSLHCGGAAMTTGPAMFHGAWGSAEDL